MQPSDGYSIDELICVCIARQVENGEILAQGIATPLVMAGYILAKVTHAPDVAFVSAIGQGLSYDWAPLRVATIEAVWLPRAVISVGFVQAAVDLLPRLKLKEFFRPGQVDAAGNFNNLAIGKNYERPRLRLPGAGGIPDVTVESDKVYLYVPRHSPVTFVEKLDFRSGLGRGVQYLISDLGQFDFHEGHMRLISLHPGRTIESVQAKTGFPLAVVEDMPETTPPTPEELRLLREEIDPLGVRKLETLGGAARRKHLRRILEQEVHL